MDDDDVYLDFAWGKPKASSNKEKKFYNSFFYDSEEYSLHDNVVVYDKDQPDGHVAKIMKLWEDIANGAMMALLRWYLRPCELPKHLQSQVASFENSKELFLAFGKGKGVSNENKLDCIERKCKVLCTSKDSRNEQPSEENLKGGDYCYNRIYNVDLKKLSNLEGIVKILGQDVLFNKPDWLSNKHLNNQETTSLPASAIRTLSTNATPAANRLTVEDGEVLESDSIKDCRENQGQCIPAKRASRDNDLPAKKMKYGSEDSTAGDRVTMQETTKKEIINSPSSVLRASQGTAERGSLTAEPALTRLSSALSPNKQATSPASEKKETNLLSSVSMMSPSTAEKSPLTVQQPLTRSASAKKGEQSLLKVQIDANNAVEMAATGRALFAESQPQLGFLIPTRARSKQVQHQDTVLPPKSQFANLTESMGLGRVLLIQNIDSSINLKDMNDLMKSVLEGCSDIQMLWQNVSLTTAAGEALLEFESKGLADAALQQFEENCFVIAGCTRPLIARKISLLDPGKIARFPGHFPLDNFKLWKQRQEEVMRKSSEIFHFADPKSLEFEMASEWRNLHEWLARCWEQLGKAHSEEINTVTEKYKKPKLRVP